MIEHRRLTHGAMLTLAATLAAVGAFVSKPARVGANVEEARAAACFAPGASDEEIARFRERFGAAPTAGPRYQTATGWAATPGDPVHLTYSFPPDGVFIGTEGNGVNVIHATLNNQFVGGADIWKGMFRQTFDQWTHVTGITFTEVADDGGQWPGADGPAHGSGARGDIRIVMGDLGSAGLGLAYLPPHSDILLNLPSRFPPRRLLLPHSAFAL